MSSQFPWPREKPEHLYEDSHCRGTGSRIAWVDAAAEMLGDIF